MEKFKAAIVIGAGNWGRPFAGLLSCNICVRLWTMDEREAAAVVARRDEYFPKVTCVNEIIIEPKFASEFSEAECLIVMAVPSSQVSSVAAELSACVKRPTILSLSKGFDIERFCTPSQLIQREIPEAKLLCLTGPTIANEVGRGLPTTAVLSSEHFAELAKVKSVLKNDTVNFEIERNPAHHELCAALKGIIAIGVGMADGLGLGVNFQSVIITRGIREMVRVASFFDIPSDVVFGLSGIGDVMTTCISPESRNRQLGYFVGQGDSLQDALTKVGMTVEGVAMSKTIETLWSLDVSIPLFHFVNNAIFDDKVNLREDFPKLLRRFS